MFNHRISTSDYAQLANKFTAKEFNAEKWAETAKKAGMKYMVLTTRHHDGFCLFDSKVSGWLMVELPGSQKEIRNILRRRFF